MKIQSIIVLMMRRYLY